MAWAQLTAAELGWTDPTCRPGEVTEQLLWTVRGKCNNSLAAALGALCAALWALLRAAIREG